MNTEIMASSPVVVKGDELEVTAQNSGEMAQAQAALIAWCDRKLALMRAEATELRASYEEAVQHKWKSSVLKRHAELAEKRVVFYDKMKGALVAGFIIVPNFPVEVFAVRTERGKPKKYVTNYRSSTHEQRAESLPPGAGEYRNPFPETWQHDFTNSLSPEQRAKGQTLIEYYAKAWQELDFPITMAKPHIMQATERAMALKIFDDFAILPAAHRNRDPMIIARLRDPRTIHKFSPRMVSFIIAWHLDTAVL